MKGGNQVEMFFPGLVIPQGPALDRGFHGGQGDFPPARISSGGGGREHRGNFQGIQGGPGIAVGDGGQMVQGRFRAGDLQSSKAVFRIFKRPF